MSKTVADFEDFIFPFAPDAPSSIIQHAVRESIVRFMRETQVAVDFSQFPLSPKVPDYVIDVPDCRIVIDVRSVKVGMQNTVPDDTWVELQRTTDYSVDIDHGGMPSIILRDAPQESCHRPLEQDMVVEYAWSISRDDCEIPDYLYEAYMTEIKDGALAELYAIPGQEWTNLQYAMMMRERVEDRYRQIKSRNSRWGSSPTKMRRMPIRRSTMGSFWRA